MELVKHAKIKLKLEKYMKQCLIPNECKINLMETKQLGIFVNFHFSFLIVQQWCEHFWLFHPIHFYYR